jgi:hypothetical protein
MIRSVAGFNPTSEADEAVAAALALDLRSGEAMSGRLNPRLTEFLQLAQRMKGHHFQLNHVNGEISKVMGRLRNSFDDSEALESEFRSLNERGQKASRAFKECMSEMKVRHEAEKESRASARNAALMRAKMQTLMRGFMAAAKEFNDAKEAYKNKKDDTCAAMVDLVHGGEDGELDEERRRKMVALMAKHGSAALVHGAMHRKKRAHHLMVNAQRDADQRLKDATALAAQIVEIKEMVNDIQSLVDKQTEQLGLIEQNVAMAVSNISKGNDFLDKAIEAQIKNRRKKCIIIVIGIVVMIVLVLGALGVVSYVISRVSDSRY